MKLELTILTIEDLAGVAGGLTMEEEWYCERTKKSTICMGTPTIGGGGGGGGGGGNGGGGGGNGGGTPKSPKSPGGGK